MNLPPELKPQIDSLLVSAMDFIRTGDYKNLSELDRLKHRNLLRALDSLSIAIKDMQNGNK